MNEYTAKLEAEVNRLHIENAQLQDALVSRIVIEQAKGLVAGAAGVDMDQAFNCLRSYARSHNRGLHGLCVTIIEIATRATDDTATRPMDQRSASSARLSKTPLYSDIMECWRSRPRSFLRHRRVPAAW